MFAAKDILFLIMNTFHPAWVEYGSSSIFNLYGCGSLTLVGDSFHPSDLLVQPTTPNYSPGCPFGFDTIELAYLARYTLFPWYISPVWDVTQTVSN